MRLKSIMQKILCLGLVGASLLSLASCALHTTAKDLSAGYTRTSSASGSVTDEAFRRAAATFALSLFRESAPEEENRLLSPTSAMLCLAMLANGTAGATRAEIEGALGQEMSTLNPALYAYAELLRAAGCASLASSLWIRDDAGLTVEPSFLQTNADFFATDVYRAAFDRSTVRDVNRWVKNRTGGMIDKLLDGIDDDNMLFLINALSFDAKWQSVYEKQDQRKGTFRNADGSESTVTYLSSSEWQYLAGEGIEGFMKSYAGGKYRFVALLPEEGRTTAEIVAGLDGDAWLALLDGASNEKVLTRTPAFETSLRVNVAEALRRMGVTLVFDENAADLSPMGHYGDRGLYCSAMRQDVRLRLDADGTKAAAATIATIDKCTSAAPDETPPHEVYLTRPFLYAIVDAETGLPLFLGTVDRL